LRSGQLPLWDPYVRNGMPFLANPQTGVFYPPSLLLVVFGLDPGLTLFLLLHVAASGAGFYLLLRAAGFGSPAASVGGVAFAMSGYVASLVNVLNNLQTVAWVPWLLAFALLAARRGARRSWFGLVLVTALAMLGGELQLAALGLGVAFLLVLVAGPDRSREGPRQSWAPARWATRLHPTIPLMLAATAALALAAVQLLPTAELLRESVRSAGLPFELAAEGSLDPASLFSLAFPRPALPGSAASGPVVTGEMPWLLSAYMGAGVVCLALVGSFGPRRRWTLFWWSSAAVGVLLALGSHTPAFRSAFELVPGFQSVRYPEKFLLLSALALPALAAAGVESALARRVPLRALLAALAIVLVSAAGSWLVMDGAVRVRPETAAAFGALGFGGTVALLVALTRGVLSEAAAAVLLCAVTALDLGWAERAVNPSVPWRFYDEKPWAARVLEGEHEDPAGYRVRSSPLSADMEQVAVVGRARFFSNHYFFQQSLAPNLGQLYGFLQQDGMAGIETRSTADQIDALIAQDPRGALRFLRLQAVRYIVTSFPLPAEDVRPVARHPELPITVVRLRGALPRAYVASRWQVAHESDEALRRALTDGFVPGTDVALDRSPFQGSAADEDVLLTSTARRSPDAGHERSSELQASSPAVLRAAWEPSAARFELELDRPGILVVTDTWFPGWRARLDGEPAPILLANGYQRAVAVRAGRHHVELEYRPASFVRGLGISGLAAFGLAVAAWHGWSRGGRRGRARSRGQPGPEGRPARERAMAAAEPASRASAGSPQADPRAAAEPTALAHAGRPHP
jgi:hypothetical protein